MTNVPMVRIGEVQNDGRFLVRCKDRSFSTSVEHLASTYRSSLKNGNYMAKPTVIVFSGYGLNCEEETLHAFEMAGGRGRIVHINDAIAKPSLLDAAQILAVPGGFSYGDDTGSGKAYGNRFRGHLGKALEQFFERDTLTIGICNGFQILTSAGILPGALIAQRQWQVLVPLGRPRGGGR